MFRKKVVIPDQLYQKLESLANERGYASTDEMVIHVLEKAVSNTNRDAATETKTKDSLRGLGYL